MSNLKKTKVYVIAALTVLAISLVPQETTFAKNDSEGEVKVVICHKAGQSGNYTRNEVSVHSVNDANGLDGHGNHNDDVWGPYAYNAQSYPGNGNYNALDFNDCSVKNTQTPAPSPQASATPTASPSSTPAATSNPTPFVFPMCQNVLPSPGDIAHYTSGMHQIVGGPLLSGSDDVYSLESGNFLQCFCPEDGGDGIQTNWLKSNVPVPGWFFEFGAQWNLGPYYFAAQNSSFSCDFSEPTPTPTITPTPTATQPPVHDGKGDGLGCAVNDCSGNNTSSIEGYGTGGQILGASTMGEAGSFTESFYQAIMALGATISTIGARGLTKGRKTSVKSRKSKKSVTSSRKKTSKKK